MGSRILGATFALALGSAVHAAVHTATDYCNLTANDADRACKSDASAAYWVAVGKCDNIADSGERGQCKRDASSEKTDALTLCGQSLASRQDACGHLGTATYEPNIDPANFVSVIDNPYFPLTPGTTYIYEGSGEHVEFAVTHNTKVILGVTCVEIHDTVTVNGEVAEDTLDWFAQDKDGNVWYMGESTFEAVNGRPVDIHGSWEAGVDGAQPGLVMRAAPAVDDFYRQEFLLSEAEDLAEVVNTNRFVSVPYGSFSHCLEIEETTPIEPSLNEHKFYAAGIGHVLQVKTATGERVELIDITTGN